MEKASNNKRVYLDWAAGTPLLPEAKAAMEPFLSENYGNPSSIHQEGVMARQAVEGARAEVARAIQVRPEFVTFTAGGTEANNLAIMGSISCLKTKGLEFSDMEVITTKIEHPSVLNAMKFLEKEGVTVKYAKVDDEGKVDLSHFVELFSSKTALVSVAYANSEIGVVQSLHGIKKVLKGAEAEFGNKIYFHVDAAQAPLWLSCQFDGLGADFLALDAAKGCGPKGVGVLVQSKRAELSSVTHGGGQERGLRPGTENVAGIVGAGIAFSEAQSDWKERQEKVSQVRNKAIKHILDNIPETILNGPTGDNRLANNINISIPGLDTEFATVVLDSKGFAVSTKSACSGAGGGESVVVREISNDPARAGSTLRFSLGPDTTIDQIKELVRVLSGHIESMKSLTQS